MRTHKERPTTSNTCQVPHRQTFQTTSLVPPLHHASEITSITYACMPGPSCCVQIPRRTYTASKHRQHRCSATSMSPLGILDIDGFANGLIVFPQKSTFLFHWLVTSIFQWCSLTRSSQMDVKTLSLSSASSIKIECRCPCRHLCTQTFLSKQLHFLRLLPPPCTARTD